MSAFHPLQTLGWQRFLSLRRPRETRMGEFLGWVQIADWIRMLTSRESRRDYPTVILVILALAACASVYWHYLR